MMDYERVKPKKKANAQVQKEFIKNILADTQDDFEDVLRELKVNDPRTFARIEVDLMKLVVPKTTDVNHNLGLSKDMKDLMLLGMTASRKALTDNVSEDLDVLTQYEEIKEPKLDLLPSHRFDEHEEE